MLQLFAYRFVFEAIDRVQFQPGGAANTFRGAFGHIFRRIACRPECAGPDSCDLRRECAYARLFEPQCRGGPSGIADAPRPFVIRAAAVDGRSYRPGEAFFIDVHVFDLYEASLAYFLLAFAELAQEGIGQGRGRVRLSAIYALDAERSEQVRVYEGGRFLSTEVPPAIQPLHVPLPEGPCEIVVRFVTPTELKQEGRVAAEAPFSLVFARARDRISTLRMLYGSGPLEIDFSAMGERSATVLTVASDLHWESNLRRSSRTGQVHPLGGFVGEVRYAGELAEFLPFLEAAYWTGIGRQTTWGKGVIELIR